MAPARQVIAQYEVIEKLGAGGMGEVYKAYDTRLRRTVAIKLLSPQGAEDRGAKRRFFVEARAASALNHPYILTVHEIGLTEDGRDYMVTEYVQGKTLRRRLQQITQGETLPLIEALDILLKVAEGLHKAHEAKIIHRDLKPENIILTQDGFIKILDFGLAKLEKDFMGRSLDETPGDPDVLQGTVGYLAPEIIEGEPATVTSDIFSLGVICYELFTGRHPFPGRSYGERLIATLQCAPKLLPDLRADIPEVLNRLVMVQMLAKDPLKREQSLATIIEELRLVRRRLDVEISLSQEAFLEQEGALETLEKLRQTQRARGRSGQLTPVTPDDQDLATREFHPPMITRLLGLWRRSGRARYVMLSLGLLIGLPGYWWWQSPSDSKLLVLGDDRRASLAVVYFQNISDDPELEWLKGGIAEMLTTNLTRIDDFEVVSGRQFSDIVARTLKKEALTPEISLEIARKAGLETLITGTIAKVGNQIKLTFAWQETKNGQTLYREEVLCREVDEIFGVVDRLTAHLAEQVTGKKLVKGVSITDVSTQSIAAFRHYEAGVDNGVKLHLEEAIINLEKAVQADPTFAMAYLQLGILKLQSNDELGAREAITRAVALIDRVAQREQLFIRGLEALLNGHSEDRIKYFREMTERYPKDKDAYRNLGRAYIADGQLDAAIATFKQLLRIDPEYGEGYNRLAYSYLEKGNYEMALQNARRYVELLPQEPNAHDTLGDVYLISGRPNEAINEYQMVLKLQKDFLHYFSYWKLANAHRVKGDLAQAETSYLEHLKLQRGRPIVDSLRSLALLELLRGKRTTSLNYLQNALEKQLRQNQTTFATLTALELATFYLLEGNLAQAEESIYQARDLHQTARVDLYGQYIERILERTYWRIIIARGDYDRADQELRSFLQQRILSYTGVSREVFQLSVQAYRDQARGNYAAALEKWQKLAQNNNLSRQCNFYIAENLFHLGRYEEAEKEFTLFYLAPLVFQQLASSPTGSELIFNRIKTHYYLAALANKRRETVQARNYLNEVAGLWPPPEIVFSQSAELKKEIQLIDE